MGKLILLLLVALVVGLSFQDSRAVILEWAGPLANPARGWMTNQELTRIVEDLELHQETRGELPIDGRGAFMSWLGSRYPQARSRVDAWGTGYRAELIPGERFRVISAGPDGEFGTEDDLHLEGERTVSRLPMR